MVKVRFVVIGTMITIPALAYFVWSSLFNTPLGIGVVWLTLIISFAVILACCICMFVSPYVAYKINAGSCVSGIPFPLTSGMPGSNECLDDNSKFSGRNLWFNLFYFCLFFVATGLLCTTVFIEIGAIAAIMAATFIYISINVFLNDILRVYPIRIYPIWLD